MIGHTCHMLVGMGQERPYSYLMVIVNGPIKYPWASKSAIHLPSWGFPIGYRISCFGYHCHLCRLRLCPNVGGPLACFYFKDYWN
jgi:hypothetical protein